MASGVKFIGIAMIAMACGLFGFSISFDYVSRIRKIEKIKKMLVLLKGEIKYKNSEVIETISTVEEMTDGLSKEFLSEVIRTFNDEKCSINYAWKKSVNKILEDNKNLHEEDMRCLLELGTSIGITERETQISNIMNTIEILDLKINELNEGRGEKCKLYRTLGMMAGMFIMIVFI